MTSAGNRRYAGATPEERRVDRVRRMKDAALSVVGLEGWEAATVRRICADAKTSPVFFYEAFPDTTALVEQVHDDLVEWIFGESVSAIGAAPADVLEQSRAAARSVVFNVTDDPRIARFLLSDAPPLASRRAQLLDGLGSLIAAQGRQAGVMNTEAPTLEATTLLIAGGASELVRAWLDGRTGISREALIEICAQVLGTLATHMSPVPHDL